ncbi:polysaccharide pyruvyl transferase family protein [Rasiella rasia]|uniref:Polysaccharide pyruvyl transferase family protein n=1 Tax=Rasiella rasia TaxID=2744027 RepID=A0A6G6GQ03_9FLAO|nr:polysaccharide pyruvyl transferase family protein [Rasiella rasia]QIE60632.1 polysaccharide pyruvyl transferase family protein [Rasiella rasia]
MSTENSIIKSLKKFHVLIVRWHMDFGNFLRLIIAKVTGQKIIYIQFARVNNFGDQFNYDLTKFFGRQLIYTHSYKKSQVALCGSILGTYLRDYSGYILGAGFLAARFDRRENNWKVKMIRGPLSAEQCGHENENVLYADPGILASLMYTQPVTKKYDLGILPHSKDVAMMEKLPWGPNVKLIHPRRKPSDVAHDIKQCKHIASSSLHGLIFADAFQIPNIHLKISDRLKGGLHKFHDYYLGMNMPYENIMYEKGVTVEKIIAHCKNRCEEGYLAKKQIAVQEMINTVFKNINT